MSPRSGSGSEIPSLIDPTRPGARGKPPRRPRFRTGPSGVREHKLTEQLGPARPVAQPLRDKVPARPQLADLVVADREEHKVQLEWLNRAAEFPFQVVHGMNGPHITRRPCRQAS